MLEIDKDCLAKCSEYLEMIEIANRRGRDIVTDYAKELRKHKAEAFLFQTEEYYHKRIQLYSDIEARLKKRYKELTFKLSILAERL